jgi:hypothetical protein
MSRWLIAGGQWPRGLSCVAPNFSGLATTQPDSAFSVSNCVHYGMHYGVYLVGAEVHITVHPDSAICASNCVYYGVYLVIGSFTRESTHGYAPEERIRVNYGVHYLVGAEVDGQGHQDREERGVIERLRA